MKILKRLLVLILFIPLAVAGSVIFPFLVIISGIDKANDWMDKKLLLFEGWANKNILL